MLCFGVLSPDLLPNPVIGNSDFRRHKSRNSAAYSMTVTLSAYQAQAFFFVLLLALFFITPPPSTAQTVRYVDANSGPGDCTRASSVSDLDGSSWQCAYPALQDALDEANAGSGAFEIQVAQGTYYPDIDNVDNSGDGTLEHTNDDRTESFTFARDGISLLGGYPSGGGTRNPESNPVVLSGDIDADNGGADLAFEPNVDSDGATSTPSQTDHIVGGNAYHVVEFDGVAGLITASTIIDGVTISSGLADGSFPENAGGGIYCDASASSAECSPSFIEVRIQGNAGAFGGGVFLNTDPNTGSAGTSSPTFEDVHFAGNAAEEFRGGAVHMSIVSGGVVRPRFEHVVFNNNFAATRGGALHVNAREGSTAEPLVTNVLFLRNRSSNGGALYIRASGTGTTAEPDIVNSTFIENKADFDGGAIYNRGEVGGSASPTIRNSILWQNINDADNDGSTRGGPEVFNNGAGAQPSISYSIVENGESTGIVDDNGASTTYDTATNLESDPQFIDLNDPDGTDDELATMDDGLRLRGVGFPTPSPAIDAGNNTAVPQDVTEDLIGNNRFYNGDGNPGEEVDIGAYEYSDTPLPVELAAFDADVTDDRSVRLQWQTTSETGNSGFRVQRSVSGTSWSTLGRVEGAGTTDEPQSYRFTDSSVPYASDSLQYRLAQVDVDGTVNVSDPVTVRFGNPDGLELLGSFPNPARSQATIRFAVPEQMTGDVQLELYDLLGRQVKTIPAAEASGRVEQTLDVSDLPSGTYLLRLSAGGQTQTQQVTIVR
jgi:predicted outer membrane repeat protein